MNAQRLRRHVIMRIDEPLLVFDLFKHLRSSVRAAVAGQDAIVWENRVKFAEKGYFQGENLGNWRHKQKLTNRTRPCSPTSTTIQAFLMAATRSWKVVNLPGLPSGTCAAMTLSRFSDMNSDAPASASALGSLCETLACEEKYRA